MNPVIMTETDGTTINFRIIRKEHTAFPNGKRFPAHQRHGCSITKGSKHPSFVVTALCMRDILNDFDSIFLRNTHNRIHIGWMSHIMNHHHCFGTGGNMGFKTDRINLQIFFANIAEHNSCTQTQSTGTARPISNGGTDDLVTGAKSDAIHGSQQRVRPCIVGKSVFSAVPLCKLLFKFLGDIRTGHISRIQNICLCLPHCIIDNGPMEHCFRFFFEDWGSPVQSKFTHANLLQRMTADIIRFLNILMLFPIFLI